MDEQNIIMKSIKFIKICIQYLGLFEGVKYWIKNRNESFENIIESLEFKMEIVDSYDDYENLDEFALELQYYHEHNKKFNKK